MKVLIADDHALVRDRVSSILTSDGWDIVTVSNGDDALRQARLASDIRIALLDWRMSEGLDGAALCVHMSNLTNPPYIIVLTEADEIDVLRNAIDAGAHDFITKPIEPTTLLARIRVGRRINDLRRMTELQSTALEATAMAILVTDRSARILWSNPAFSRLTGYTRQELIGESPAILRSGEHPESFYEEMWSTIERGDVWRGEVINRRKDGTRYTEAMTITPVVQQNEITHFVAVKEDITARKALESQQVHAQKLESIGLLAAGIAHEINTPVQYIGDNLRFLDESAREVLPVLRTLSRLIDQPDTPPIDPSVLRSAMEPLDLEFLDEEVPLSIAQALDGVARVASIVRAMKEFSHPGGDEKVPEDLSRAIETTVTMSRNQWKYVAELEMDLDPDLPLVPCHVGELNQVILNMIVNAADAIADARNASRDDGTRPSSELGRIVICTRRDGDHAEIRISDSGPGVPPDLAQRVFDPFFTTKAVGKGTGQGLAISHDIVTNKHGGTLAIESPPGEGATFIIRLPLGHPSESPGAPVPAPMAG